MSVVISKQSVYIPNMHGGILRAIPTGCSVYIIICRFPNAKHEVIAIIDCTE